MGNPDVQYRIDYTITQIKGGEETEIGFGTSNSWSTIDGASYAMESDIQNRLWETSADMPDPRDVDKSGDGDG